MSLMPTVVVTPAGVADAYARADRGDSAALPGSAGFGATLQRTLESAVEVGHTADRQAAAAINGTANLTDVVTALAQAELTLQTATAIRDRVVQAYQDIIRMPI
ncbi:MAG: flagellar hook-basal body complex protein FliE [Acetobacteraceae bacterium]